jgi:beta-mannosidase
MSEYGFQSWPSPATLGKYSSKNAWAIDSKEMLVRQKSYKGNAPILREMAPLYGRPKDFSSFLILSQYVQREAMRIAITAHRLKSPFCMGTLYWQLNDCWPGPSWSTIDFEGEWKPAHFELQRLYAPILLAPQLRNDSICISIVSEHESRACNLQLRLKNMKGDVLADYQRVIELKKGADAYLEIPQNALMGSIDPKQNFLEIVLHAGRKQMGSALLFFGPIKALALPDPDFSYQVSKSKNGFSLKLEAKTLVKDMEIQFSDAKTKLSDNFFDLSPGQIKTIEVQSNDIKTEQELLQKLRFRDLRRLLE